MFELIKPVVLPERLHEFVLTYYVAQLRQKYGPLTIGRCPVCSIHGIAIRMGGLGLFLSGTDQTEIPIIRPRKRVLVLRFHNGIHAQAGNKGGKPFIHPGVFGFIGRQDMLEPGMGQLVHHNAHQAIEIPLPGDQGAHGVFHATIPSLYNRILPIGIRTDILVEKSHGLSRLGL